MEDIPFICIAISVILLSIWLSRKSNGKKRLPGPIGLPIVGYLPFMTKKPYAKLAELSKTYGPVYSLPLGSKRIVVITDFKNIKEAFGSDDFFGRPSDDLPLQMGEESLRTEAFNGLPWKEQRRFCLHTFRDLGFGKTRMEEHMIEEIQELVERLQEHVGKTVRMADILASSVSNNVASLLFGRRMRHDDPTRMRLNTFLRNTSKHAGALSWQIFFPWIRAFMKHFGIGNHGKLVEAIDGSKAYCRKEINKHEATLDPEHIRDFVDGYLLEIRRRADIPDTTFRREVLTDLSRLFFSAGSESVRNGIDWMLLVCAAAPSVQADIHMEIDEVLGRERFPTGQDRPKMPRTEAALCEVMRWVSLVPINVMRRTLKDTELNGYFIPKGSGVLAAHWAVDHNEALWGEDAHEYRAERFLSADRKTVIKPEHFNPFSIGKRACPAKSLAETEMFLYVTAILQKFEVRMPPGKQADFEGVLGIGLSPKTQELCLNCRKPIVE